jgi:hypothetical protein
MGNEILTHKSKQKQTPLLILIIEKINTIASKILIDSFQHLSLPYKL